MYIYNITLSINLSIHNEWLIWIEKHILTVLNTGKFSAAKLTEVLVDDDANSKTYAIQYTANSRQDLDSYYQNYAEKLRQEGLQKFGDKVLAFRTELRLVKEFYPLNKSN